MREELTRISENLLHAAEFASIRARETTGGKIAEVNVNVCREALALREWVEDLDTQPGEWEPPSDDFTITVRAKEPPDTGDREPYDLVQVDDDRPPEAIRFRRTGSYVADMERWFGKQDRPFMAVSNDPERVKARVEGSAIVIESVAPAISFARVTVGVHGDENTEALGVNIDVYSRYGDAAEPAADGDDAEPS